MTMIRI